MKRREQASLSILLASLLIALTAGAYDYPLSPEAIREAYFLGKAQSPKRAEFFENYTQRPPMPEKGSHVALVQLETPYAVVVERAAESGLNYFPPDAEEEFLGKPAIFRLHVQIDLTPSYGWQLPARPGAVRLRPDNFWRDFTFRLVQGKIIRARAIHGMPIYGGGEATVLVGASVDLEYEAAKIRSAPATVEVLTPEGQKTSVTFDLAALR